MNEIFLLIGEWTEEDGHATSMPDIGFRLCRSVNNIPGVRSSRRPAEQVGVGRQNVDTTAVLKNMALSSSFSSACSGERPDKL